MSISSIYNIHEWEKDGRTGTTKTGPNEVRHIVWALGKHFSFFSFVLFDTNKYFIAFIGIILQISNRERSEASTSHCHHPH